MSAGKPRGEGAVVGTAVLLAVMAAAYLLMHKRMFIPQSGMNPTLLAGDYILVSRLSYGVDPATIGAAPADAARRWFVATPTRGDVAVYLLPSNPETYVAQRLVGLPGDTIEMRAGVLHVNGSAVPKAPVEDFVWQDAAGGEAHVPQFEETLPNGVTYRVLDSERGSPLDDTPALGVPPGHYFFLGDNRDQSFDSRPWPTRRGIGMVPFANLIGRATRVYFSAQPGAARWKRIGRRVR